VGRQIAFRKANPCWETKGVNAEVGEDTVPVIEERKRASKKEGRGQQKNGLSGITPAITEENVHSSKKK